MPDHVMSELEEANQRFVHRLHYPGGRPVVPRFSITGEQHPHTLVLTCSDSRIDPAVLFDAGLGEFFVVRVAGNVWEEAGLAAAEFAVNELEVRAVLVLGHTGCGAMLKAIRLHEHGERPEGEYFSKFIERLVPSVIEAEEDEGDIWVNSVRRNVDRTMRDAVRKSKLLKNAEESGTCAFLGGVYDIESGRAELWRRKSADLHDSS
jgi:carbonic anhydrase